MLDPSIDELLTKIDSKYTLVTVSAKRARNIRDKKDARIEKPISYKFVGMALEEIREEKLTFKTPNATK